MAKGVRKMKLVIKYKDGYVMTLNGVNDIQGGEKYICLTFSNKQAHKGTFILEVAKIENVRFE